MEGREIKCRPLEGLGKYTAPTTNHACWAGFSREALWNEICRRKVPSCPGEGGKGKSEGETSVVEEEPNEHRSVSIGEEKEKTKRKSTRIVGFHEKGDWSIGGLCPRYTTDAIQTPPRCIYKENWWARDIWVGGMHLYLSWRSALTHQ